MSPFFGGHWFDRIDPARADEAVFAAHVADPAARMLVLDGLDPVLEPDGRLAFAPLTHDDPLLLLGMIESAPLFAAIPPVEPAATRSRKILGLLDRLDRADAPVYAAARSVIDWHARHGFCAASGHPTRIVRAGWGRHCDGCGADHFPRVDPVVIMLATCADAALVGRQPQYPYRRYSALAGFLEPGESIEDAVARELWEEAGVRTTGVSYVASQPWPFPSSLMIGCIASVDSQALTIDRTELEDAFWISADEAAAAMANRPGARFIAPPPYAIAHDLLRAWLA